MFVFTVVSVVALCHSIHESQAVGGVMSHQANIKWMCVDVLKVEVKLCERRPTSLTNHKDF